MSYGMVALHATFMKKVSVCIPILELGTKISFRQKDRRQKESENIRLEGVCREYCAGRPPRRSGTVVFFLSSPADDDRGQL